MIYVIGITLFGVGAFVALFAAGQTAPAWTVFLTLVVLWAFVGTYLAGIRYGMRNNDL